jgi:DNA repair exonuclease SbcCD nuclease subunit
VESQSGVRILFLSDTHLGFDMTPRPRIERRRRGKEFFDNFDGALAPALEGKVDVVVHGGDLFYRSRIPNCLAVCVLERIRHITDSGVSVVIVPGNHERSALPSPLLWNFPNLHVFDEPQTIVLTTRGMRIAFAGLPYNRADLREEFSNLISMTGWNRVQSDIRLLCMHQIVQGARVGTNNFTFTRGRDVIPKRSLPSQFACVLAGHIHRFQVLDEPKDGGQSACRVFYSGSTARTSFAERTEQKGYLLLNAVPTEDGKGMVNEWEFRPLPSRPMETVELSISGLAPHQLKQQIEQRLAALSPESIVRLKISGIPEDGTRSLLTTRSLRSLAPTAMNIDLRWARHLT